MKNTVIKRSVLVVKNWENKFRNFFSQIIPYVDKN